MYEDDLEILALEGLAEGDGFEDELYFEDELEMDPFEDEFEMDLFEDELEMDPFEDEFEMDLFEDEFGEFEDEWELDEFEDEWEFGEFEGDEFLKKWWRKAKRAVKKVARNPVFRRIAKRVARVGATALGGFVGGPAGAALANRVAGAVLREVEFEGDYEVDVLYELEAEGGDLEEYEEMEYLAEIAAETESEAEATAALKALAKKATRVVPGSGYRVGLYIPLVRKGVFIYGKLLRTAPRTRPMIKALPTAAAKSVVSLKKQARAGKPATPKRVIATMARHMTKTMAKPRTVKKAIKRNRIVARRVKRTRATGLRRRPRIRRYRPRRRQSRAYIR